MAGVEGQIRYASFLLVHRNAMRFSTGLRTFLLKNSSPNCFFKRKNPLSVRVLQIDNEKIKTTKRWFLFWQG